MATLTREHWHLAPEILGTPEGYQRNDFLDQSTSLETATAKGEFTQLLAAWGHGDLQALDEVFPLAFEDLRLMARKCCSKIACGDLQPTELIGEIYDTFRLQRKVSLECRGQFFRFAALLMQRTLLDHKRRFQTPRRGGDKIRIPIEALDWSVTDRSNSSPNQPVSSETPDALGAAIDIAKKIDELAKLDPNQAETARLRCLVGLTVKETAEVLNISVMTVNRKWRNAKRFLAIQLDEYASK